MLGNPINTLAADERIAITQGHLSGSSGMTADVFDDVVNDGKPDAMTAPTLGQSATGGIMVNGQTIQVRYSYYRADGTETAMSNQVSGSMSSGGSTQSVTVTCPAIPSGFAGIRFYKDVAPFGFLGSSVTNTFLITDISGQNNPAISRPPDGLVAAGKRIATVWTPGPFEREFDPPIICSVAKVPKVKTGSANSVRALFFGYIVKTDRLPQ